MSVGLLCDHCRKSVIESTDTAGWLALTRIPKPEIPTGPSDVFAMFLGGGAEAKPRVERGVHFCSPECLVAYVQSGMRGLLEIAS